MDHPDAVAEEVGPGMRVGDNERRRALEVLRSGYGEGSLTLEEYEDRLARTHAPGLTVAGLRELVVDLPAARAVEPFDVGGRAAAEPEDSQPPSGNRLASRVVLVVLAVVLVVAGARADSISVFGSGTLNVEAGQDVTVLNIFGSTQVVVPDEVIADGTAISIFGSLECEEACRSLDSANADDRVTVGGLSLFGSVEIVRPDETGGE